MKNDTLQFTLAAIAEQAAPSAEIDLWMKMRGHLETSESIQQRGDASMKITFRRITLILLAVIAGLAILFATPQGQAFAQTLFRFFSPTESKLYPTPEKSVNSYTPTPVPTFTLGLKVFAPPNNKTAENAIPIPTSRTANDLLKNCRDASAQSSYACQIALAESKAGFDALELPAAPNAMAFTDAQGDTIPQTITINYTAVQDGTYLILTQGLGTKPINQSDQVPANAIEEVKVGGYDGEFVQGQYVYSDASGTSIVWDEDPGELRLVWAEGNRWFSLTKLGNIEVMGYMDKKFLLELGANLVDNPGLHLNTTVDDSYQMSLPEAQAVAGFPLLLPGVLPEGFEFSYAYYDTATRTATLFYHPKGQPAGVGQLVILETALGQNNPEVFSCKQCPAGTFEKIKVNGATAYYSDGSLDIGSSTNPLLTPIWHADPSDLHLTWSTPSLFIVLNYSPTQWYGGQLEKETLVKIAESMK